MIGRAIRVQLPVGFGGFRLAALAQRPPATFREFFVLGFDCGSLAKIVASSWATSAPSGEGADDVIREAELEAALASLDAGDVEGARAAVRDLLDRRD